MIAGKAPLLLLAVILAFMQLVSSSAQAQEDESGSAAFAFKSEPLNVGLPADIGSLRLDTPRASLEAFLEAIRRKDFRRAGATLNLNAIPAEEQADRAPELALMLAFILRRYDLIDWTDIPDQPDARVLPRLQQSTSPYKRRSVELGTVELDGRPIPISLQRFQPPDGEAVWLFSPFMVERVPDIYREPGRDLLSRWLPLSERVDTYDYSSTVERIAAALMLTAALVLGLLSYLGMRLMVRLLPLRYRRAGKNVCLPLAVLIAAVAFRISLKELVVLTLPIAKSMDVASEIVALAAGAWLVLQTASGLSLALSRKYVVPLTSDDPENRRIQTAVYVARRLVIVAVALVSIGYILLRVGIFESFGISILASAGALGVLVAIAARPLLGNMVAGLQIALTDPVRIGDVVVFDEHWATVEDISFAHTVLRTWIDTRIIVPHSDLLSRPFENWSKEGDAVRRIVKIPVDYRIDVDSVREKVKEIVESDARATSEPPQVEMVELTGEVAVLWVWISATSAFNSWYLHNEVREKLVKHIRELEGGRYLPRRRHLILNKEGDSPLGEADQPNSDAPDTGAENS
ncbi:mechanosensitive ion channel family protein [Pseudohoeflea coraliihabitans]|uniref:Mechanosensitive ion channel family protein n=1 Tax=Pseudohoeflea coraliihabitans TaxID=2860393 RepID=A0ABS6WLY9_9HYPH|nr:mechanosensitive ion channel domain-containing protein [Pseudohoeflea sp. DP4N28-3]MBW3096663.1 mechanosensitive ion channel family protein [Pseudohoeflea sp. DP4N28-3]